MPRLPLALGPAALLAAAFAALLVSLAVGGGAEAGIAVDPGAVVRYGLPIAKLLLNLGIAVALGALVFALFAMSPERPEFGRALDIAAAGAGIWTVAAGATALFSYGELYGSLPGLDPRFGSQVGFFLTEIPLGRAWLIVAIAGAILTVLCFAVRNATALAFVVVAAALALVPLAEEGHAASEATHAIAVTAIWLHTIFAAVWVGGLIVVALLGVSLGRDRMAQLLPRYSTIALICFIVVAASGFLSALVRIGDIPALLTPYGALVIAKVVALGALGLAGAFQRRAAIRRIAGGARAGAFGLLVAGELVFMGIASGVAAALARTATPVVAPETTDVTSPAEILTGRPLPPEFTLDRWFTSWTPDLLWMLVAVFGIVFYLAGVLRLRARGDRWPLHRTVLWTAGMLSLLWVTTGPIAVYEEYLFSAHMLGHMLLSMTIPVLLVLSAPITLALRTIRKRDDGSRGPREWILLGVHSRWAGIVTNPIVAAVLFAASLWVFYYTPLFRWSVEEHVGHTWMVVHFLLTGYLFAQALVGIDPIAGRPPYPLRLLLLLATMAMHAFFGLTLMTGTSLLLPDWYGAMGRTWGADPLADQQAAGGIAWSVGEIPTLALAILVAILWSRSDAREAKRTDRTADRDGDAELSAYNAMLAKRGESDPTQS